MIYVVYNSYDDVIITTVDNEQEMLNELFYNETGRVIDDYNRTTMKDTKIIVTASTGIAN